MDFIPENEQGVVLLFGSMITGLPNATQKEIADQVGCSPGYVSRVIRESEVN